MTDEKHLDQSENIEIEVDEVDDSIAVQRRNLAAPSSVAYEDDEEDSVAIPVKVKETIRASMRQSMKDDDAVVANDDAVVAEYESRYSRNALHSEKRKKWREKFNLPPAHRRKAPPAPENLEENERLWAALAHASALLTIIVGMSTFSLGALVTLLVPLGIYIAFREKSEFVARHALQAFAAQVVGMVGFIVLLIGITVVWVPLIVISAILVLVIVGFILLPLVIIAGLLAYGLSFLLPLAMLVYGMIAAVEAWSGHHYSYPWIGDWVDDQIYTEII